MCFVTLTYADDNIRWTDNGPSLYKPDLQMFWKKLRKKYKIRYYAVGEYGGKTKRPHYHALIFGLNHKHYNSIQKAWSLGNVHLGDVNIKTIKYVTKYHVNKNEAPYGVWPEFTTMSLKPAIGASYIDKMANYHDGNLNRAFYSYYNIKMRLPRYYKQKLYTDEEREELYYRQFEHNENIDEWEKKNPGENFFQYQHDKNLANEESFKSKKRKNETI